MDEIIQRLFERIPAAGSVWPPQKRVTWLNALKSVFELLYLDSEAAAPPQLQPKQPLAIEMKIVENVKPPQPAPPAAPPQRGMVSATPSIRGTGTPRPSDIPTTFAMFRSILEDKPGLTAAELMVQVEKQYWPGLDLKFLKPEVSTYVTQGKLSRDLDGRLTVTPRGSDVVSVDMRKNKTHPRQISSSALVPTVSKPAPAKPAQQSKPAPARNTASFEYGSAGVDLEAREYIMASKLRAAMGKGVIDYNFLATAMGIKSSDAHSTLSFVTISLNPKLEEVGLKVEHLKGMGYVMKEIAG